MNKPEEMTSEWAVKKAQQQAHRFMDMVEAAARGAPCIRVDECISYIKTYGTIVALNGEWDQLTPGMKMELLDCWYDERG